MIDAAPVSTSALHTGSLSLLMFCIATFVAAALMRTRLLPAAKAGPRKLASTWIGQKVPIIGTVAEFVGKGVHFALAIVAVILFALSGIAATATPLRTAFDWVAGHPLGWVVSKAFSIVNVHMSEQTAGESAMVIVGLFVVYKMIEELAHGRGHKGELDMLIFLGPMLFALIPGFLGGRWADDVYNWIASVLAPYTAHWF